ncbi:MAG: hypothetical protein Fur0042_02200 [Cyanophyceae cyanobacterium]
MQSPTRPEERTSLWEHFQELEDPRTQHLIEHQLLDILALTLCAIICGAESWVEVELYGKTKAAWLSTCRCQTASRPMTRLPACLRPSIPPP